ncbi:MULTISPECIES: thioredoxin family protein [Paenibacillus]|uniref:thioredoxin family protein n=1 Tax=Paenibacillus TaxID=44249 RepID=UPI000BBE061A|nr:MULTISPECIES: thioredoxin family protein [Paenibacillus]PCL90265.1 thiol reductase thioredoxin [Paenibacillus lautus]QOT11014.1 thioredoxin family protein [Paenibacillus sp. JNUCC-32]WFB56915.1 thioredoxin family protein [Paenibacillus sp. BR1-192]
MNRKKKNKYTALYAFGGVFVLLVAALVFLNGQGEASDLYGGKKVSSLNPATQELLNDPNYQQIILPDQLKSKVDNKENFFVYFFASDCPHCRATTPELMPLADDAGITMHQYNLREYQEGWREYNIEFTPTLVYFENGIEKERMVGGLKPEGSSEGYSIDDFKQFLDKYKGSVTK